ncbi:hypothetical protein LTR37_000856 [Vermiconidia calcicola]|uniref:Uncharacterized protein n=1 Tax=Vermiconidia calcicola TaxID=1690605 RepID=A0ACC3NXE8_9PEZI|nr:hypothetical protein LTR37_000856 [Vermiconidia calcicola]
MGAWGLNNVKETHVILDADMSRAVSYPYEGHVRELVRRGMLDRAVLEDYNRMDFAESTASTLSCMLRKTLWMFFHALPSCSTYIVSGVRQLCTEGQAWYNLSMEAFPNGNPVMARLSNFLRRYRKRAEYGGVQVAPGQCLVCMSEWTEEHWSWDDRLKICLGLSDDDTGLDTPDPLAPFDTDDVKICKEVDGRSLRQRQIAFDGSLLDPSHTFVDYGPPSPVAVDFPSL